MQKKLLQSLRTFFTMKDPSPNPHPDNFEKIETIQDALAKLRELYSSHDLKRCEEIANLYSTLKEAQSFNPLTPVNSLPDSKKHLISKYL